MPKQNLIMLSMEDEKIKKVANVVSNDSCRKILDYLAENEASESELAKKLSIPISTVHYNLQQLMDAGLVTVDEFHYSEKGKEVNHYKLANKYIIIAPKKTRTSGLKSKLKSILPVALIAAGTAAIIEFTQRFVAKPFGASFSAVQSDLATGAVDKAAAPMMAREMVVEEAAESATKVATDEAVTASAGEAASASADAAMPEAQELLTDTAVHAAENTTDLIVQRAPEVIVQTTTLPWQNIALWFFIGALFSIIVWLIWNAFRKDPV